MSLKNSVLDASGLDFGGHGPAFWRVWGSFSEVLAVINGAKNAKKHQKPAKQELNHKLAKAPKGGWAAVIPPRNLQSAGHRRCANGVPNTFPTGSVESQLANLDILSRNSI